MAGNQAKPEGTLTRAAARDLSSYQYHAVYMDSNGAIDYVDTSSSGIALGILQNKPDAAGAEAEVATEGTSLMYVDGDSSNITGGATLLGSNSNYHGVAVSADTNQFFALALEDSTADGDLIEVKLLGAGYISAT